MSDQGWFVSQYLAEIITCTRAEPLGGTLHACRLVALAQHMTLLLPSFVSVFVTDPVLLLVVWALKREVRAIRGCLGAYRR